jgi:ATP-dependent exoDNAse (exonuclease V) beta subunit
MEKKYKKMRSPDGEISVTDLPKSLHAVKFKYNNFLESKYGWISAREKEEMEEEEVEDFLKLGLATHSLLQNIVDKLARKRLKNALVTNGSHYSDQTQEIKNLASLYAVEIVEKGLVGRLEEVWGTEVPVFFNEYQKRKIDLVGIHEGKLTIIDYKTSKGTFNGEHDAYDQVIEYKVLHDLYAKRKVEKTIVMICDKDGYREIVNDNLDKTMKPKYEEAKKYLLEQKKTYHDLLLDIDFKLDNLEAHI